MNVMQAVRKVGCLVEGPVRGLIVILEISTYIESEGSAMLVWISGVVVVLSKEKVRTQGYY